MPTVLRVGRFRFFFLFPIRHKASAEQRARCEVGGGGISLHWPELDEDLSVAGLMAGVDWRSA
jgi:hypothetical protein